ncbi:conserved hypothetical protein [Neospora caninum Liverpool]|uniref:BRCT domain-containing protein n=1 Tax=Neospora caninum (strain Liverpool) TaxID=572307 RepID=F0VHC9_NEOCL|nr:conserved hypothetical protein [Neospora caninum Liverpool]CBZ53123.1 conserved hypothetical protein [Neospora caninum Liverpool]|eukprot:XP_003883155.1 conserved hypothetical protein [Neospora caninum Liverpool]
MVKVQKMLPLQRIAAGSPDSGNGNWPTPPLEPSRCLGQSLNSQKSHGPRAGGGHATLEGASTPAGVSLQVDAFAESSPPLEITCSTASFGSASATVACSSSSSVSSVSSPVASSRESEGPRVCAACGLPDLRDWYPCYYPLNSECAGGRSLSRSSTFSRPFEQDEDETTDNGALGAFVNEVFSRGQLLARPGVDRLPGSGTAGHVQGWRSHDLENVGDGTEKGNEDWKGKIMVTPSWAYAFENFPTVFACREKKKRENTLPVTWRVTLLIECLARPGSFTPRLRSIVRASSFAGATRQVTKPRRGGHFLAAAAFAKRFFAQAGERAASDEATGAPAGSCALSSREKAETACSAHAAEAVQKEPSRAHARGVEDPVKRGRGKVSGEARPQTRKEAEAAVVAAAHTLSAEALFQNFLEWQCDDPSALFPVRLLVFALGPKAPDSQAKTQTPDSAREKHAERGQHCAGWAQPFDLWSSQPGGLLFAAPQESSASAAARIPEAAVPAAVPLEKNERKDVHRPTQWAGDENEVLRSQGNEDGAKERGTEAAVPGEAAAGPRRSANVAAAEATLACHGKRAMPQEEGAKTKALVSDGGEHGEDCRRPHEKSECARDTAVKGESARQRGEGLRARKAQEGPRLAGGGAGEERVMKAESVASRLAEGISVEQASDPHREKTSSSLLEGANGLPRSLQSAPFDASSTALPSVPSPCSLAAILVPRPTQAEPGPSSSVSESTAAAETEALSQANSDVSSSLSEARPASPSSQLVFSSAEKEEQETPSGNEVPCPVLVKEECEEASQGAAGEGGAVDAAAAAQERLSSPPRHSVGVSCSGPPANEVRDEAAPKGAGGGEGLQGPLDVKPERVKTEPIQANQDERGMGARTETNQVLERGSEERRTGLIQVGSAHATTPLANRSTCAPLESAHSSAFVSSSSSSSSSSPLRSPLASSPLPPSSPHSSSFASSSTRTAASTPVANSSSSAASVSCPREAPEACSGPPEDDGFAAYCRHSHSETLLLLAPSREEPDAALREWCEAPGTKAQSWVFLVPPARGSAESSASCVSPLRSHGAAGHPKQAESGAANSDPPASVGGTCTCCSERTETDASGGALQGTWNYGCCPVCFTNWRCVIGPAKPTQAASGVLCPAAHGRWHVGLRKPFEKRNLLQTFLRKFCGESLPWNAAKSCFLAPLGFVYEIGKLAATFDFHIEDRVLRLVQCQLGLLASAAGEPTVLGVGDHSREHPSGETAMWPREAHHIRNEWTQWVADEVETLAVETPGSEAWRHRLKGILRKSPFWGFRRLFIAIPYTPRARDARLLASGPGAAEPRAPASLGTVCYLSASPNVEDRCQRFEGILREAAEGGQGSGPARERGEHASAHLWGGSRRKETGKINLTPGRGKYFLVDRQDLGVLLTRLSVRMMARKWIGHGLGPATQRDARLLLALCGSSSRPEMPASAEDREEARRSKRDRDFRVEATRDAAASQSNRQAPGRGDLSFSKGSRPASADPLARQSLFLADSDDEKENVRHKKRRAREEKKRDEKRPRPREREDRSDESPDRALDRAAAPAHIDVREMLFTAVAKTEEATKKLEDELDTLLRKVRPPRATWDADGRVSSNGPGTGGLRLVREPGGSVEWAYIAFLVLPNLPPSLKRKADRVSERHRPNASEVWVDFYNPKLLCGLVGGAVLIERRVLDDVERRKAWPSDGTPAKVELDKLVAKSEASIGIALGSSFLTADMRERNAEGGLFKDYRFYVSGDRDSREHRLCRLLIELGNGAFETRLKVTDYVVFCDDSERDIVQAVQRLQQRGEVKVQNTLGDRHTNPVTPKFLYDCILGWAVMCPSRERGHVPFSKAFGRH